jgi:hypothetical protein
MNAKLRVERFIRQTFARFAPAGVDAAEAGTAFGMELSLDANWQPDVTHKIRSDSSTPLGGPTLARPRRKRD